MQSQTSTAASSLAALGHNSLFAAFTAHQGASALQSGPPASFSAPQAASHMAGGSGGSGAEGTAGHVPPLLSQIHPAFLHPFYHPFAAGIRPAVLAAAAISAGNGNNNIDNLERPGSAGKSFTIDAILGTRGGESAQPRRGGREAAGPRRGGPTTAALSPLSARGTLQHRSGLAVTHPGAPHPYLSSLTAPLSFRSAFSTRDKSERKPCHLPVPSSDAGEAGDWGGKGAKAKRVRTIFTPEQLERLETEFERQQYMVGTERYYLAASLNLTEAQVKVWFQNRRIKWRKTNLELQHQKLKSISDLIPCGEGIEGDSDSDGSEEVDLVSPVDQNPCPSPESFALRDTIVEDHPESTTQNVATAASTSEFPDPSFDRNSEADCGSEALDLQPPDKQLGLCQNNNVQQCPEELKD